MRIQSIQNYQIQPMKTIRKRSITQEPAQTVQQPSFKSGKGALWGAIGGALFGAGVIIATGGIGAIGLGLAAYGTGSYAFAGAIFGDQITEKNDNISNDHKHLHVH